LTDGAVALSDIDQDGHDEKSKGRNSLVGFNAICLELKRESKLSLYSIGYDVKPGNFTNALSNCIAGDGQYFAAGVNDLNGIFANIVDSVDPIRITN